MKTKKIVITNEKGGTGKSTISALLTEYLIYLGKKVKLVDIDPIQSSQTWINNCLEEGRKISDLEDFEYLLIDTSGTTGSSLSFLKESNLIIIPFQANYTDIKVTIDWFDSIKEEWKKKSVFIPNRWRNTKDQREGLGQISSILLEEKQGYLTEAISDKPALYGNVLQGNKDNFFDLIKDQNLLSIFNNIMKILEGLLNENN